MRQPRSNLYCYGCDWYRDGCDADIDSYSDHLGFANANETKDRIDPYVRRWINVSLSRSESRAMDDC